MYVLSIHITRTDRQKDRKTGITWKEGRASEREKKTFIVIVNDRLCKEDDDV